MELPSTDIWFERHYLCDKEIGRPLCYLHEDNEAELTIPEYLRKDFRDVFDGALDKFKTEGSLKSGKVKITSKTSRPTILDRLKDFYKGLSMNERKTGIYRREFTTMYEEAEYECRWVLHSEPNLDRYFHAQHKEASDLTAEISKHFRCNGWNFVHFYPVMHDGKWYGFSFWANANGMNWKQARELKGSITPINGMFDPNSIQWDYAILLEWDIEKLNKETEKL